MSIGERLFLGYAEVRTHEIGVPWFARVEVSYRISVRMPVYVWLLSITLQWKVKN